MNQTLEKNICNLPDGVANREVNDLHERAKRHLDPALRYACKSWHKHLTDGHTIRTPAISSALHRFLEKKFLFWLEVLSVLGAAREAVDALDVTAKWLEMSPTLDLINDCFRFVMGFFEIISTSCPHIYHSALPLCPRKSIVRSLYESHARPFARIVRGLPDSWGSSIAVARFASQIYTAVWSPCSRFIAILLGERIEILDAVTLSRVTTLYSPEGCLSSQLVFSPNTRLLTSYGGHLMKFTSWDLQTGGLVSSITLGLPGRYWPLLIYPTCGAMVAGLHCGKPIFTIFICDVLSGTHKYSHPVEGEFLGEIWTHGECLRFATVDSGSMTTWEVGFASPHTPTPVECLPIPDNFHPGRYELHPTSSRLAFATERSLVVWDAQHSKFLLQSTDFNYSTVWPMSFSSDGRFLVCSTGSGGIHLWKESPTGYTLHQKFTPNPSSLSYVRVSPDGESITALDGWDSPSDGLTILLWRIADSNTSLSDISALTVRRYQGPLIVELSSDEVLAAVARRFRDTVTVLDLKFGITRLTIDTGMGVHAVGVDGSAVVVVGEGKIITWSLPAGNNVLNPRAGVNDSVLTTTFNCPSFVLRVLRPISVSPDLRRIAIIGRYKYYQGPLYLYDVPTGNLLAPKFVREPFTVSFSPDGHEVWSDSYTGGRNGWKIAEDSKSNAIGLKHLESRTGPPGCFPFQSSRGYEVTDDRWVLSPGRKRLLWLPPGWRLDHKDRRWSGRFLMLLGSKLPEPVILELEE
ncbi:YVTN repeat-like/Quino protein amine dehydrogenase [Thelephora ganbajun]|uniref:YVTN repeat-like/Quino protein amine dehydrogenase n=1 Tax=Thelephora ganbajun TaxID=370292 RepID=A0ACB6Z904_THEGA|nr:YVTN repeat-like/Quino protein amine dehydrogenase [Thelephora ganbajun]